MGDWTYSDLPGRYEIWRINSRAIVLALPNEEYPSMADNVVEAYVFEVAYNNDYICAKRADVPEDLKTPIDISNPEYYVVDVAEEKRYGPFDEMGYHDFFLQHDIKEPTNWMDMKTLRKQ